jgi:hypothetical protein
MKKFKSYLLVEQNENIQNLILDEQTGIDKKILEIVFLNINTSDKNVIKEFLQNIVKDGLNENNIKGLLNDSDFYEIYITFKLEIDKELVKEDYFSKKPSDSNLYSLYDLTLDGCKKGLISIIKKLIDKL